VDALLEAGAAVDVRTDPSGSTPLHLAAAGGSAAVIQALVASGADVDVREAEWQQTPLIFAASWNRLDAMRALLDLGADPNLAAEALDLIEMSRLDRLARERRDDLLSAFTNEGAWTATPTQVQAAVRAGRDVYRSPDAYVDEESSDQGGFRRPVRVRTKGGLTPLLHAARQGHVEATRLLLERGADVNQVGGGDGTSPLLMATVNGQFDVALVLLEGGADPNLASSLNAATPLFAVINAEWQPRTRFPQPQERDRQQVGYLEMARALLEAGADPDARLSLHPWFMEYTDCGNSNCGLIDMNGATAFLRAAYATDVQAMQLLHEWGADPFIATRAPEARQRRSPDESQRERALEQIATADSLLALADSSRVTLVMSVWSDLPDSVKLDLTEERVRAAPVEVRHELFEHAMRQDSVKAARPDPSGLPRVPVGGPAVFAIHAASGVGYGEGFAGNAHRHAENGWLPSVRYLVEEIGMDVNARDHNGYNAIHHAAARGDNELILYLVEHGGDVTAVSRRGQTTADMANGPVSRVSPIPETVALLESLGSANSNNCLTCRP
jgi:ankyrin repeat protein